MEVLLRTKATASSMDSIMFFPRFGRTWSAEYKRTYPARFRSRIMRRPIGLTKNTATTGAVNGAFFCADRLRRDSCDCISAVDQPAGHPLEDGVLGPDAADPHRHRRLESDSDRARSESDRKSTRLNSSH